MPEFEFSGYGFDVGIRLSKESLQIHRDARYSYARDRVRRAVEDGHELFENGQLRALKNRFIL